MSPELEELVNIAAELHSGVNHLYDNYLPYIFHLIMVANTAVKFATKEIIDDTEEFEIVFISSLFHDTLEDTRTSYNDLKEILSDERFKLTEYQITTICEIVYALTNEKGRNRAERANENYYEGIRKVKYASFIKMCDRFANMSYGFMHGSSMLNRYRKEMEYFLNSLNQEELSKFSKLYNELANF